ncbi:MAG: dTDP-4-dehydrorhamnose 3,5-epimerase family protein [Rubrivivax sp.]|nr:dTDP-4-dehydrorhamnose 3,5-epimerase family protein [Rubrivivax sp.]
MKRFELQPTPLSGLVLVQRQRLGDARGFLSRLFCTDELAAAGWTRPVRQINHTHTARRGCVRGLHFQHAPHAEAKLVSCLRGAVFDVAVDLRAGSPTFLRWHASTLTADNGCALLIPEGFAHGFQTLTDDVEMLYCHSAPHVAAAEGGIHPLDEQLAIDWPLPVSEMSPRDAAHARLATEFEGVSS